MSRAGIISWGVYVPCWRLQRSAIGGLLGSSPGKGTRAVASYDEDTTTLAVEAGRRALASASSGDAKPEDIYFSTPAPAYLDKTNATAILAALDLPASAGAYDLHGSVRSGVAALRMALSSGRPSLVAVSDLRTGLAGGTEESESGDGAVAFVAGTGDGVAAELVAHASASAEFLDRWRAPGASESSVWEERFGQEVYVPLVEAAWAEALKQAGVSAGEIAHLATAGLHARAVGAARGGLAGEEIDRRGSLGNLGAAQAGLGLADALERAKPGELIAVVVVADGADVLIFRTTDALRAVQQSHQGGSVAEQAGGGRDLDYARALTWRGQLTREPPRRPDPERPGAPATWRVTPWKGAFKASDCGVCGFRHLPPARVCLKCKSIDQMSLVPLAGVGGVVATFTIDRLAFSLSPPVVGVIVDFDGGGRYRCEMTDVDIESLGIGTRVEMTFRRIYTAKGVHNYFWKARPA